MKKIAVIGKGLAGLASTFYLLEAGFEVTVFFSNETLCTSALSVGLLHPYPGKANRKSLEAEEGMQASLELLKIAGASCYQKTGMFRPANTPQRKEAFQQALQDYPELIWKLKEPYGEGLWIEEAFAVELSSYLKALQSKCSKATFIEKKIEHLDELQEYDQIVLAMGYGLFSLLDAKERKLKATKGQALLGSYSGLSFPVNADVHLTPLKKAPLCQLGSTYERHFSHSFEDPEKALPLRGKARAFCSDIDRFHVEKIEVGVRISPMIGHTPILQSIGKKGWFFSGLGSRGLLYHALYAKKLAFILGAKKN